MGFKEPRDVEEDEKLGGQECFGRRGEHWETPFSLSHLTQIIHGEEQRTQGKRENICHLFAQRVLPALW